jgi:MFS family permease
MGSLMVAPIISGAMAENVGWRNFWWLYTALLVLSIVMVAFMFPETKWHRGHHHVENVTVTEKTPEESSDKKTDAVLEQVGANNELGHVDTAARDPYLGRGKPSKAQWGLYTPNPDPIRAVLLDLWIPWKLFAFPIVELAAFIVSWSCSSFLTLNLTQTQAFAAPPYNFTTEQIGFTNFAILVGAMIGLFTAGPFSDWVSARQTVKNRGIREPEMRLLAMIPYVIVSLPLSVTDTSLNRTCLAVNKPLQAR